MTPGQVAYTAWERALARALQQRELAPAHTTQLWQLMSRNEQAAWEAAAQAVLAHGRPQEDPHG